MPGNPSAITTSLAVDPPLAQNAAYRLDANDRQYIDNQIRGCEQHLVTLVINGTSCTYVTVDAGSTALAAGDVVALAGSTIGVPTVTKGVSAALTIALSPYGIAMLAASPGAKALIAIGGVVPPSITGLGAASGACKVNTSTARATQAASFAGGDYVLGTIDAQGYLNLMPGYGYPASGATPTGTGIPHIISGVTQAATSLVVDADVSASAAIAVSKLAPSGTNTQVLTTTAGVAGWAAAPSGGSSAGATSGQVQTGNGAGAFTAPSNVLAGTNFVSIGATPAASGSARFDGGTATVLISYAYGGSTYESIKTSGASSDFFLGDPSAFSTTLRGADIRTNPAGSTTTVFGSASTSTSVPVVGASSPFAGMNGMFTKALAGSTYTLAASEYCYSIIKVTGTGINGVKLPAATDAAAYMKFVWNTGTGILNVFDSNSVTPSGSLGTGQGAWFLWANAAVKQLTAVFTVA